jgi:hypothetical protein
LQIRAPRGYYQLLKIVKNFDAVEMMRKMRDKISAEIEGMTLEEEFEWLATQEFEDQYLRRLQRRADQQA